METETLPEIHEDTKEKVENAFEKNWKVIVWNDPVNFMDYVTHVFEVVFGWARQKAEFHMRQVDEQGRNGGEDERHRE